LFVPASSVLALIIIKPLLTKAGLLVWIGNQKSLDGILGIVSYGFPFAALRAVVTRVALGTLREFAAITKEARAKEESICPPQEILS
jgi:adenine/guanine phosphoribosyltransferase-like PRPP-binding protein